MQPTSNEVLILALAVIHGLFALLLAWRCYHFATLEHVCASLEWTRGEASQLLSRRNWYGAPELDLQVRGRWFRIFTGPWLPAIAVAARPHAILEVGACSSGQRPRAWSIRGSVELLDMNAQLLEARGDAKATGVMAVLSALLSTAFYFAPRPAA